MFYLKCNPKICSFLPDNNNRFICQFVYLTAGILVLFAAPENFTFFQVLLFIVPILIDIICSGPNSKLVKVIRWIIGIIYVLLVINCAIGLGGYIVDFENRFEVVKSMLIFGGLSARKEVIGIFLMINILIPISYFVSSPCKKTANINQQFQRKGERAL